MGSVDTVAYRLFPFPAPFAAFTAVLLGASLGLSFLICSVGASSSHGFPDYKKLGKGEGRRKEASNSSRPDLLPQPPGCSTL